MGIVFFGRRPLLMSMRMLAIMSMAPVRWWLISFWRAFPPVVWFFPVLRSDMPWRQILLTSTTASPSRRLFLVLWSSVPQRRIILAYMMAFPSRRLFPILRSSVSWRGALSASMTAPPSRRLFSILRFFVPWRRALPAYMTAPQTFPLLWSSMPRGRTLSALITASPPWGWWNLWP